MYNQYDYEDDSELYHFGIKGMKWGVRKDRYHSSYSDKSRSIDKAMYGRGGVRRINKRLSQGIKLNDARAMESRRLVKARRNAKKAARIGGLIGGVAGGIGGGIATVKADDWIRKKSGFNDWVEASRPGPNAGFGRSVLGGVEVAAKNNLYYGTAGRATTNLIAVPMVAAGAKIGSRIGKGAYMLYSGYSPKHFR
jgi:hypothetical protein